MFTKIFFSSLLIPLISLLSYAALAADRPVIIDQPVEWSDERARLTEEYAQLHYGQSITQIVPQAVVIHWTAGDTWESAYYHFYHAAASDGTMNYAAHFIVDRDGTIRQILPETTMGRHIIGYNWCTIGIENVGGGRSYRGAAAGEHCPDSLPPSRASNDPLCIRSLSAG